MAGSGVSSPAISGTSVYVSSGLSIYALNAAAAGAFAWTYPIGTLPYSSPAVSGSNVYVGGADGYVYAFGPPCVTPPSGMVAWWPLDETSGPAVTDIVGGHNGVAMPGPIGAFSGTGPVSSSQWPPPTFPPGKVDKSLFFYGNRYVNVATNSALEPGNGNFTIDAWVIYAAAGNDRLLTIAKSFGQRGDPNDSPARARANRVRADYSGFQSYGCLARCHARRRTGELWDGVPYYAEHLASCCLHPAENFHGRHCNGLSRWSHVDFFDNNLDLW